MASTSADPVVVVLQRTGANDDLTTVMPYTNPLSRANRPPGGVPEDEVLPMHDTLAFHPNRGPVKKRWDAGTVAIIQGIGYAHSPRSHFRAMDIWHTCAPDSIGTEGWAGRVIRALDPTGENVRQGVNVGQGLPRAMVVRGVPVTSVAALASYGVLTGVPALSGEQEKARGLERFARMDAPAIGTGPVMDCLGQTGQDVLQGVDVLTTAPQHYASTVQYADTPVAHHLRHLAQVSLANLGPQLLYTAHGSFDTHLKQVPRHTKLWSDVSTALENFGDDLRAHATGDTRLMVLLTEFGRCVHDNGTGTDHGAGGVAFVIGNRVKGGMSSEYPSLRAGDLHQGDLAPHYDFRGFYATVVEQWSGLDPVPIVGGHFAQLACI